MTRDVAATCPPNNAPHSVPVTSTILMALCMFRLLFSVSTAPRPAPSAPMPPLAWGTTTLTVTIRTPTLPTQALRAWGGPDEQRLGRMASWTSGGMRPLVQRIRHDEHLIELWQQLALQGLFKGCWGAVSESGRLRQGTGGPPGRRPPC